jgi:hypothetical protein
MTLQVKTRKGIWSLADNRRHGVSAQRGGVLMSAFLGRQLAASSSFPRRLWGVRQRGCHLGDSALIGAHGDETAAGEDAGSAYVYTRSAGVWTQQSKLTAADGAPHDQFGMSVALAGRTALIGANGRNTAAGADAGCVYGFTRAGDVWTQQPALTAGDAAPGDHFGYEVAFSRGRAVVAAPWDDTPRGVDAGSAYVVDFLAANAPGKPTPLSPRGAIAMRRPTFRWKAVAGAQRYEVRVYKGSKLLVGKAGLSRTSWKCSKKLPRDTRLTWKVRAANSSGTGAWSTSVRFRVS